ncbi:MAG: M28 family metallopeptidase [Candidatus Asgardarchaeia archaeon]
MIIISPIIILSWEARASYSSDSDYSWLINLIEEDPTSTYNYAEAISNFTIDTTISHFSYRAIGSPGERYVFEFLKNFALSRGLIVKEQMFEFTNWDIYSVPNITINNGNEVFTLRVYPAHYSYGTPNDGLNGTLVYLPLPETTSTVKFPSNISEIWNTTDITGKIVIIGREVRFVEQWLESFLKKIMLQRLLAILYIWATKDYEKYPMFFSSYGGRIHSEFRALKIPIAWIRLSRNSELIRNLLNGAEVTATLRIPINETTGYTKNLMVTIPGKDKSKVLLVTAHYDSVMTPAFSDNGAGVASLLELEDVFGKAYSNRTYEPPINITFVFFTGEEVGLVGSAEFLAAYKEQLKDSLVGVVNIDTLGSYTLEVARDPTPLRFLEQSVYLHDIISDVADEFGETVRLFYDTLHSDDSTFSNPQVVTSLLSYWWPNLGIDLSDVDPFPATMIGSFPYLPWQQDPEGRCGWIHTPFDNATSTETYDWMNPTRLEKQVKIVAVSVYKVLELYRSGEGTPSSNESQDIYLEYVPYVTVALVVIIAVGFILHKRKARVS